jgi:hypothetical protein
LFRILHNTLYVHVHKVSGIDLVQPLHYAEITDPSKLFLYHQMSLYTLEFTRNSDTSFLKPSEAWFLDDLTTSTYSSGGMKRSNWGRTSRNKHTLIAPERLKIESQKNVAAEGTDLCWNCDQRATEVGRRTREYARG